MILQLLEDSVTKAFKKEFKSSNPFYLPDEYKLCHKLSHGQGQGVQCGHVWSPLGNHVSGEWCLLPSAQTLCLLI